MRDPETGKPFLLLPAERTFLQHAFKLNERGRRAYPEQVYGCPKKSGKTAFAAMHLLATTLLFGGRYGEGFALANDVEQASSRVFQAIRRIVEDSPLLAREAKITQNRIEFPETGGVIQTLSADYGSAAGGNPSISSFDELADSPASLSPPVGQMMPESRAQDQPSGWSPLTLASRASPSCWRGSMGVGLVQPQIDTDLYAGDGLLMFWSHIPITPGRTKRGSKGSARLRHTNACA